MSDLIIFLPNHDYIEDEYVTLSWLSGGYYVRSVLSNSFKISLDKSDNFLVQYTETITTGFVREQTEPTSTTTTITGLEHLEGQQIYVTSNGEIVGSYTVTLGEITVPSILITYQVGIPYALKIKTMRLEAPQTNTLQSRIKRINETVVRTVKSKGGQAGQEYDDVEYLENLNVEFSEKSKDSTVLTKGGFSEDGYTVIKSGEPYPFSVIATIVSFSVDENR